MELLGKIKTHKYEYSLENKLLRTTIKKVQHKEQKIRKV